MQTTNAVCVLLLCTQPGSREELSPGVFFLILFYLVAKSILALGFNSAAPRHLKKKKKRDLEMRGECDAGKCDFPCWTGSSAARFCCCC